MIATFATLLLFQAMGEGLSFALALPVPGPVLGMLLLLAWLALRDGAAARLAPAASGLLGHLALLFVPAATGIIVHTRRVADEWLPIALALLVSTVASVYVTAAVIRRLRR